MKRAPPRVSLGADEYFTMTADPDQRMLVVDDDALKRSGLRRQQSSTMLECTRLLHLFLKRLQADGPKRVS
jgi:DNA topoisomerase VI subunit A